jgi:hypothetical protein
LNSLPCGKEVVEWVPLVDALFEGSDKNPKKVGGDPSCGKEATRAAGKGKAAAGGDAGAAVAAFAYGEIELVVLLESTVAAAAEGILECSSSSREVEQEQKVHTQSNAVTAGRKMFV